MGIFNKTVNEVNPLDVQKHQENVKSYLKQIEDEKLKEQLAKEQEQERLKRSEQKIAKRKKQREKEKLRKEKAHLKEEITEEITEDKIEEEKEDSISTEEISLQTEKSVSRPSYSIRYSLAAVKDEDENFNGNQINNAFNNYRRNDSQINKYFARESLENNTKYSFSQKIVNIIAEKHKTNSEVYKKAGIDRKLFSKIIKDNSYKPSKDTAFALIIGLELNIDEAKDLLERAGFSFSHSIRRDIIVEYFINSQVYDLMIINEVLYSFDEKTIG